MKVLISGGAGYIGSTIASILLDNGHQPVILDSLVNGRREFADGRIFYQGDIADRELLKKIFSEHSDIEAAVHCAALILVPESEARPADYYRENVSKSVDFFEALKDLGCKKIIFSSSASVYGSADELEVSESSPLKPSSPYARTKMMMEAVLSDFCRAYDMKGIALRYFNPIGADPKMRSGAYDPRSTAVMRALLNAAAGDSKEFAITGTNWPTRDGSGIRDYLHVWDLARAHLLALERFDQAFEAGENYSVINIGTGNGVTVKELVAAFERVLGREIIKREVGPRPGDVAGAYASRAKAERLLGWKPELSIEQATRHALEWEAKKLSVFK
jgi:UDP-glucose 4-epimerase